MVKLKIEVESDYETELLITILENILKDDKIFGEAKISTHEDNASETIKKIIEKGNKPNPLKPPYKPDRDYPYPWNDKPYPMDPNKVYFIATDLGIKED